MKTIKLDDYTITFRDDQETKDKVFDFLIENFYNKYDAFSGEVIMQSDDPLIAAPEVLSDIADEIIKFEYKDNE